jgi:tetratricopeptide (TPR) repeat protein
MVLTGGCLPYGEGITFWPVLEVVKQATGITEEDTPERARAKIVNALMGDDSAELAAERVAELLGLVEAGAAVEEGFWGVRKLLEALGLRRPLVVVFDDANWAEPTLLDLIEYLSDWSREAPILLVCMARQELLEMRPGWGAGTANATTIALEPLSRSESDLLIENLLGRAELAEEVRARIREAAEGNPLFVEEMLEMLIDGGLLRRDDGRWIPTGDLSRVPVPPTIQALLASRLDQLDPAERHVIERAAVEGKTFHRGSVRALTDGDARERVGAHLLALARKGLVRPSAASFAGEDAFRFRHVLIREAAYESLPKRVRANLHDRFASWLEEVAGERVAEYEELLGYHLEQAFRYRTELSRVDEWAEAVAARGGSRLASAGRRALTRGDVPAAVNLLERAVSLLGEAEGCPPDVLLYLGAALHEAGELARADAVLGEAVATAERAGEAVAAERARIERSALRFYLDPAYDEEEAVRVAQKAIGVFTQAGDEVGLAEAWRHLAYPKWNACRLAEMEEMLAEALVHAERAGDERARDDILNSLCRVAIISPTPVERGIQRCRDTLDGAGRELAAVAEVALGVLVAMQGGFAEARERVARSHAALEELGHGLKLAAGSMYTAYIELLADNVSAAEHELRRGYHAFDRMGERSQLSSTAALLGFALEKQGLVDEADEYIAVSRDTASAQDRASQVLWRIAGARILLRRGRSQEAGELARRAVELAQKTDFLDLEGHAHATLGGILRAQDRLDEAHARLERAASLHDRKGNAVLAGRVRTKLAELSVARLA